MGVDERIRGGDVCRERKEGRKGNNMILRISELKMRPDHTRKEFERELRKILQKKDGPLEYEIMRRSIDARKKPDLFYVYTVDVKVEENAGLLKKIKTKKVAVVNPLEYQFPYNSQRRKT